MTIIFSNMLDSDCQVLRCTWQNISDVNIVEITPDMNIDELQQKMILLYFQVMELNTVYYFLISIKDYIFCMMKM